MDDHIYYDADGGGTPRRRKRKDSGENSSYGSANPSEEASEENSGEHKITGQKDLEKRRAEK